jgi:hypothetical protein
MAPPGPAHEQGSKSPALHRRLYALPRAHHPHGAPAGVARPGRPAPCPPPAPQRGSPRVTGCQGAVRACTPVRGRHSSRPCGFPMTGVCAVTMLRLTWVVSRDRVSGKATTCCWFLADRAYPCQADDTPQRQGIARTGSDGLPRLAQARAPRQSCRCPTGYGPLRRPTA